MQPTPFPCGAGCGPISPLEDTGPGGNGPRARTQIRWKKAREGASPLWPSPKPPGAAFLAPGDVPRGVWFVLLNCWLAAKGGGAWLYLGSSRRGSRRSTGSRFPGQGPDSASEIVPLSSAPSSSSTKQVLHEYSPREMYSLRSHSLRATPAGVHLTRDTCPVRRIGGPGTEITCGSRQHRSSPVRVALLCTNVSRGAQVD